MKFMISYFYQVRFMKPEMIPISTAKWDPKWFHDNNFQNYTFVDRRGVINGLRAEIFAPNEETSQYCLNCKERITNCEFLRKYKEQLDQLDFSQVIRRFERFEERYLKNLNTEPIFILLVHEAPSNHCSERLPLIQYFGEHGIELKEFNKIS